MLRAPKPRHITFLLNTSPEVPASGPWARPQNLNRTTTDAGRHKSAQLSLPPLANTMQMCGAEHDPGCPEASTPVRSLVCQQENDCGENLPSITLGLRRSALHAKHRGTGSRDVEVERRQKTEQEGARTKARKEGNMKKTGGQNHASGD